MNEYYFFLISAWLRWSRSMPAPRGDKAPDRRRLSPAGRRGLFLRPALVAVKKPCFLMVGKYYCGLLTTIFFQEKIPWPEIVKFVAKARRPETTSATPIIRPVVVGCPTCRESGWLPVTAAPCMSMPAPAASVPEQSSSLPETALCRARRVESQFISPFFCLLLSVQPLLIDLRSCR